MYMYTTFYVAEIVAAVASVFIGYRVVAAFGSVCVGAGFLAASFVTPSEEIELMNFLVGFLGGMHRIVLDNARLHFAICIQIKFLSHTKFQVNTIKI